MGENNHAGTGEAGVLADAPDMGGGAVLAVEGVEEVEAAAFVAARVSMRVLLLLEVKHGIFSFSISAFTSTTTVRLPSVPAPYSFPFPFPVLVVNKTSSAGEVK